MCRTILHVHWERGREVAIERDGKTTSWMRVDGTGYAACTRRRRKRRTRQYLSNYFL
jgi:hypothetical protein